MQGFLCLFVDYVITVVISPVSVFGCFFFSSNNRWGHGDLRGLLLYYLKLRKLMRYRDWVWHVY